MHVTQHPVKIRLLLTALAAAMAGASLATPAVAFEPGEPSPVPTATPAPTPSPVPTATSAPTPSPVPTATPAPTPSPTPTPDAAQPTPATGAHDATLEPTSGPFQPSVHAEMLLQHAADEVGFEPGGAPTILLDAGGTPRATSDEVGPSVIATSELGGTAAALPNGLQREVLGFLPYWMLTDADLAELNYQLLSTIAYFSVGARSDGSLDTGSASAPSAGWAGWNSSRMTQVIDRAHANGVRVVLTVTMMAWDEPSFDRMRALLTSSANRDRLVGQIVDAVRSRGADGVNLDFEYVPSDLRSQYTSFVRQVKTALVEAGVGSYLTVCTTGGAATWTTGYDVPGLVAPGGADHLFVMGYDYHWSGSARAGGVAPIDSPYVLDVATAMADFLRQAPASKLIWGVPYYGRGWNTTSSTLNGTTTGGSFAKYYTGHVSEAGTYGRLWDAVGKVPWYRYWSAAKETWVQVYYDDTASLGVKYDLVNRHDLAGTGIWHLLMDGTREELWRLIADRFVVDTAPPAGGIRILPQLTTSNAIPVAWHAIDYQSGLSHYNVQVRDRASSTWSAWLTGTSATSAVYLGAAGRTYEFRVQAVDRRGNAQPWIEAPGKPASVRPGTFARVVTSSLNVRSGPGTGYGIVDTVVSNDRLYIMSGPVSAGGLEWFQVQYGFAEWPSAEYARIGWVAKASGSEEYLTPAYAPSVSALSPFAAGYARSATAFSPNGDGMSDAASMRYSLVAPASAMRIDVVGADGGLVRRIALGAQPAGEAQITWDGRNADGVVAPDGTYLVRLHVTDTSGATHVAPVDSTRPNVVARWGVTLDTVAPAVTGITPAPEVSLLPASARFTVRVSEPITSLTSATVRLRSGSDVLPAVLGWTPATLTVTVTPTAPLPTGGLVTLEIDGLTDVARNRLPRWTPEFATAPGQVLRPFAGLVVRPGTHTGYRVGAGGDVTDARTITFSSTSGASVSQRASLPNLPGRWLYVENGAWAGMWLPESSGTSLPGERERRSVPASTRLVFLAGTHTGYRYDSAGVPTASRTAELGATSGANTSARAIINGRPHWYVTNGIWAGWWMPDSARAHVPGFVERTPLPTWPRIAFQSGTYTGYTYADDGTRLAKRTATLDRPSGAPVEAWAIVNGRPHFLIAAGIWDGRWVPVDDRITLAP